ncbi:MAG TPA: hypothetical protein VEQ18_05030, partial [Candidatus Nitrosocosmicus sp.]|nr:hypothetical protein [Candidatus Nitrosocosmicus sp.]
QYFADTSKLRTGIHNALKWLDADACGGINDKKNWLSRDVQKYGDISALDFFGRDATKDFKSKWVHLKDFTSFEAMEKHGALIPSKV